MSASSRSLTVRRLFEISLGKHRGRESALYPGVSAPLDSYVYRCFPMCLSIRFGSVACVYRHDRRPPPRSFAVQATAITCLGHSAVQSRLKCRYCARRRRRRRRRQVKVINIFESNNVVPPYTTRRRRRRRWSSVYFRVHKIGLHSYYYIGTKKNEFGVHIFGFRRTDTTSSYCILFGFARPTSHKIPYIKTNYVPHAYV